MGRQHFKRTTVGTIGGLPAFVRAAGVNEANDLEHEAGLLIIETKDGKRFTEVARGCGDADQFARYLDAVGEVPPPPPKRLLTEKDLRKRLTRLDEAAQLDAQAAELTARAAKIRAEALS